MSTDDSLTSDDLRTKAEEMFSAGVSHADVATFIHENGSTMSALFPNGKPSASTELLPHHRKELCEGSGLSEATILAHGIHSETNASVLRSILNCPRFPARGASGIVFPFLCSAGRQTGFARFKPDNPRKDRDGKTVKYEAPRSTPNRTFFPLGTIPDLVNPQVRLIVTEGEKKSLKATQEGLACIGLTGVFAWRQKRHERLIPDLEFIDWKGREVIIAFDSDVVDKPNVLDAESRLAALLTKHGANVRVLRIPSGEDGSKRGLDDFLVESGSAALHKLINESQEPTEVDGGFEKTDAKELDAMKEANSLLEVTATHKEGNESYSKLRFWRDNFLWWTGTHYREESAGDVRAKIVGFLDMNFYRLTTTAIGNVTMCLKAAANVGSHREMPSWFDSQADGTWIALKNGILNVSALLKGEPNFLVQHTPRYFSANVLPYDFDPNANCPKWLAFLERNLEGDRERIQLVQQFSGYCFAPTLSAQKFLFNEGEGANGKSVYCAALTAMLGIENVSSVPLETFGERFALYPTIGKLANIAAEVGEIDRVSEGILKSYVTGDAIQFDRKHRDPITARPTAKLVFASNNRPRFSDKSGGLWRRMILMPWRITIPENERIRGMDTPGWWVESGELPGILLWAIAGLYQLEQQGSFTKSAVCESGLTEYRAESNPTRLFLDDNYRADPESDSPCDTVYGQYDKWMKSNGFHPLSAHSFGHEIRRAFPAVQKRQIMRLGDRFNSYCGMAAR